MGRRILILLVYLNILPRYRRSFKSNWIIPIFLHWFLSEINQKKRLVRATFLHFLPSNMPHLDMWKMSWNVHNNYFIKKNYKENQWPLENALLQKMYLDNDEGQHIDKGKLNKCIEKLVWTLYLSWNSKLLDTLLCCTHCILDILLFQELNMQI